MIHAWSRAALGWLVGVLLTVALPRFALAQVSEPELEVSASARQVEVNEPFTIELKALADQGAPVPTDPELRAPAAFQALGPQVSTQMVARAVNGRSRVQIGIGATWQLTGTTPGKHVIPAPSVLWNGKRLRAKSIPIEVVTATGRPRRPRSSPFLLPGGPNLLPFSLGRPLDADDVDDSDIGTARDLSLDVAPDPLLFVRAIVDKKTAVVGEQVTLSFYLYERTAYDLVERREAPMSDFLRLPLLKNPGADRLEFTEVAGRKFFVKLLDRVALIPLRAGDLHTGSMRIGFATRRQGPLVYRESDDLVIRVTEPPKDDRPPGYVIGDVGQFALSASVQPRRIERGGSVAVTLRIAGKGNIPHTIKVPARKGVEWLDPEKRESIEPQGDVIGGWRSFGYVVRIGETGSIDLGTVELPYWDPAANRYQVAVATLGSIDVKAAAPTAGTASAPAAAAPAPEPFAALPPARTTLQEFTPAAGPIVQGMSLWILLAAPPLLAGLISASARVGRRVRDRRAADKVSAPTLIAQALRDAAAAETAGDPKSAASAVERALHHAIEGATGLKSRGVLLADLPREIEARGVGHELAAQIGEALAACEAIRFDPDGGASAIEAIGRQGRAAVQELQRLRRAG